MFRLARSFRTTFLSAVLASALVLASLGPHDSNAHEYGRRHHAVNIPQRDTHLQKRFSGARMTWYHVGVNACGSFDDPSDWIIALNIPQFANGAHCYDKVTINYNGKSAVATVTDECVGCPFGGIDLSPSLFEHLIPGGLDTGTVYDGVWEFGSGGGDDQSTSSTPKLTSTHSTSTSSPPPKTTTTKTTTTSTSTSTSTTQTPSSTKTSSSITSTSSTSTTSTSAAPQATVTVMDSGNLNQFNLAVIQLANLSGAMIASSE